MTAIKRRLVLLFPGFEPLSRAVHTERFERGARMAADVWGVGLVSERASGIQPDEPDLRIAMSGDGWHTQSEIVVCDWSDTIARYSRRPFVTRLKEGFAALLDFATSGTARRYFQVSWRYGLFYSYPLVLTLLTLVAAFFVAVGPLLGDHSAIHLLWSIPAAILLAALVALYALKRLHFMTLMDDWAFARALARNTDPALAERIASQARSIERGLTRDAFDEIVMAGHSLGVSLGVLALSDALSRARPAAPVHVLTVGASLLKTALHPAAARQREAVRALVEDHRLLWVDVQSLSDPLNFYRSNPARSLGITGGREPITKRISLGKLVLPKTRARLRRDVFRRHRQFVYGTERRHAYSFHMILTGPVGFERFAQAGDVDLPPLPGARHDDRSTLAEVAP